VRHVDATPPCRPRRAWGYAPGAREAPSGGTPGDCYHHETPGLACPGIASLLWMAIGGIVLHGKPGEATGGRPAVQRLVLGVERRGARVGRSSGTVAQLE
jgi:hypothetical protein